MKKVRLFQRIRDSQEALLAETRAARRQKRSDTGWTVKDHVVHLAAWQDLLGNWLERAARGQAPRPARWSAGTIDRMNADFYARYRHLPMSAARDAFRRSSARALAAIDHFTEAELNDPHRFAWWDGEPILTLIEGNTYGHIAEHLAAIRARIEEAR